MSRQYGIPLPEPLLRQFAALQAQLRNLALLRGFAVTSVVAACALGGALLADLQWNLSAGVRVGLLAGAVVCITVAAAFALVRPLLRRMTLAELAAVVERAHPRLAERLLSTVELNDPSLSEEFKGSAYMRAALNRQTLRASGELEFAESVSANRSLRIAIVASAALIALLAPLFWSPAGYGHLWGRLFNPWGNHGHGFNLYFAVEGGDRTVARGDDVEIAARAEWRAKPGESPRSVRLNWTTAAGVADSKLMEFDAAEGAYRATLPRVAESLRFDVSSREARSREYRIQVAERPEIVAATLDVDPPAYTGRPAEAHDGIVGEMPVFERSRLRFRLGFNKPVESAELVWLESEQEGSAAAEPLPLQLADGGREAVLEWTAVRGGAFAFRVVDEHGLTNIEEPVRRIVYSPDLPPRLEVAGGDQRREVRPSDSVAVAVMAGDDVGLGALELHYDIGESKGEIAVEEGRLGVGPVQHEFTLDLAALGMRDGQVVTYRVRAADERPVPGPNDVWSEPRVIAVSRDAPPPGAEDLAQRREQQREELEEIRKELEEKQERVAELQKEAAEAAREDAEFERSREIGPLAREESELAEKLAEMAARLGEHPLFSKLMDQARQLAQEQLAQGGEELQQAANAPVEEQTEALKKNAEKLASIEEGLERLREQFDELAALEQDLLALERLAVQAEALAQQAAEMPQDAQGLEQERSALAELLEQLLQRRPEILEAARRDQLHRLSSLAEEAQQLAEAQERLSESLSQQPEGAAEEMDAAEAASQVAEAQERQQNLVEQAAALAMNVARQRGPESAATEQATQTARQAEQARREAESGELARASEQLSEAAQSANQAAEQLAQGEAQQPASPELAQEARELAQALAEQSEQLEQLSRSPSACQACKQGAQQGLAGSAAGLGRRMAGAAGAMQSTPLKEGDAGQQAAQAGEAAAQAVQSMGRAAEQIGANEPGAASESGQQAADDLRRAGEMAGQAAAAAGQQGNSPVPPKVGGQVADAARHLAEAQRQLAQNGNPQNAQAGEQSPGEGHPGQPQPGGEPSSQNALAQALQQAAQALIQAAQQMQPGGGPLPPPEGATPGSTAGNSGSGALTPTGIAQLDAELQRLATSREWGRLSSELRTEILQAARKRPHGEYAHLIRLYFEEIAKTPEGAPE